MGKRSDFARVPRDFYPTPEAAVRPLLAHLAPGTRFVEPCAGDGALVDSLTAAGHVCVMESDIEPQRSMLQADALTLRYVSLDCIITNPPWDRKVLHPLIVHLSDQAPTWLLFDADWVHTRQAVPFLARLRRIVSVGRVRWIPDSKMTGKDNCAWHLFDRTAANTTATFFGRQAA
jgi:hypothetical protein